MLLSNLSWKNTEKIKIYVIFYIAQPEGHDFKLPKSLPGHGQLSSPYLFQPYPFANSH